MVVRRRRDRPRGKQCPVHGFLGMPRPPRLGRGTPRPHGCTGGSRASLATRTRPYGRPMERNGVGLFARMLTERFPVLPVEEEGRLKHPLNRYPMPAWVGQQVVLNPYPKELMLRNHV